MRRIKTYIGKRLLLLFPILFGVTFLTYGLMYLSPHDPAEMMFVAQGMPLNETALAAIREKMGLNHPFWVQYLNWLWNFLHGDLGISFSKNEPVADIMLRCLPVTVKLALYSCFLTTVLSIPLGILTAVKQNRFTDYIIRFVTFVGVSAPNFFIAFILMYVFSIRLGWLPVISSDTFQGMLLPIATLAVPMTCKYIRQVRAMILEELGKDYVKGARARGIPERVILFQNVLKNSMLTLVTLITMSAGSLLGGTAVVEIIFSVQGLGSMAMSAINARDYPLVQGFVVWTAIIFALINLVSDLLYHILDPRIRFEQTIKKRPKGLQHER